MRAELAGWRKSSYSAAEGNCVEVGVAPGAVGVRDTKDRDGGTLVFHRPTWDGFLSAVKEHRFDMP